MNIYIWDYARPVSGSYHNGGGIACVAESLEAARKAIFERLVKEDDDDYYGVEPLALASASWQTEDPSYTWTVEAEPTVILFPDSGCC